MPIPLGRVESFQQAPLHLGEFTHIMLLFHTVSHDSGVWQLTYKNNTYITLQQGKFNSANAVSTIFDLWMLAIFVKNSFCTWNNRRCRSVPKAARSRRLEMEHSAKAQLCFPIQTSSSVLAHSDPELGFRPTTSTDALEFSLLQSPQQTSDNNLHTEIHI